jgi:hypothetical protein
MATLGTFTAGQVLTAAELNAIGTWQTWTPTLSGFTATTTYARYATINDWVICEGEFVLTGTPSSTLLVSWPVQPLSANYQWGRISCGGTYSYDISASIAYPGFVARLGNDLVFSNPSLSSVVNPTNPFTWVTGDVLVMRALYERA